MYISVAKTNQNYTISSYVSFIKFMFSDDGTIMRRSAMASGEEHIVNVPLEEEVDIDELLINLVQARPPLWDFTLPLVERGRMKIKQLWEQISTELGKL